MRIRIHRRAQPLLGSFTAAVVIAATSADVVGQVDQQVARGGGVRPNALVTGQVLSAGQQNVPPASDVFRLTLEEAVRRALQNNPDLAIVQLNVPASDTDVAQARSAFTPVLTASVGRTAIDTPPTNRLFGTKVEITDLFGTGAVKQRLRQGGGTWSISTEAARTNTTSLLSNFSPLMTSNLMLAFSQPLFRDRAIDFARRQLIVANSDRGLSDLQFKESLVRTVASVKTAYWTLKANNANVGVFERSLELANELVKQNEARVEAGQLPPLEVVSAQAEAARRQGQLIVARALAGDAEDRLRALIVLSSDVDFWNQRLDPVDEPPAAMPPPPDLKSAVAAALGGRLDIQRARQRVDDAATDVRYFTNQQQPDVRLEASYTARGLGGTPFEGSNLLPRSVEGGRINLGDTFGQLVGGDYPSWSVGVTVSYPLGKAYEESRLARSAIERDQARARVSSLETQATAQVRGAVRQLSSTAERVEAARTSAALVEQRLQVEQTRMEAGFSTAFFVMEAQRELLTAQVGLLGAILDYQSAVVAFEAVQLAPALGVASEISLRGSTVLPVPPSSPNGIARAGVPGLF